MRCCCFADAVVYACSERIAHECNYIMRKPTYFWEDHHPRWILDVDSTEFMSERTSALYECVKFASASQLMRDPRMRRLSRIVRDIDSIAVDIETEWLLFMYEHELN